MESLFRNTLGPASWIVLGMIPPAIFALYFLKLKRQPLEVPSTYLWHRVIEDLHVNSLWQRLRKSLLLVLQLLVVCLAMLALLRPGWRGESLEGQQFIFLIDNSASMLATDSDGGETRLQAAKKHVAGLIEQMDSDMSAMIIAFANQPDVVQEFTNDRRQLREALYNIQPTSAQTDLAGALKLADGYANPARVTIEEDNVEFQVNEQQPVDLFIVSDGRFPRVEDFSLGNLIAHYLPVGSRESQNLAITAFNTRRNDERPELLQAFVQLYNASEQETQAVVELYLNEQLYDAADVRIAPRSVAATTFTLSGAATGVLRARLQSAGSVRDALQLDNQAFATLHQPRDGKVLLVTPGNNTLETVLATEHAAELALVEKIDPETLREGFLARRSQEMNYDLIIFDQCVPETMPQANTLFVGQLPPLASWKEQNSGELVFGPQVIDWERSHPLTAYLELGGIQVADAQVVRPPLGGQVLVDSTAGPLVSIAPREQFQDVVLGFEIVGKNEQGQLTYNTDWPRKYSFPSFWLNVLEYLGTDREVLNAVNHPQQPVEFKLATSKDEVEVRRPDGSKLTVLVDNAGRALFSDTDQLGVYDVMDAGHLRKQFAVNLFDRQESDVALRTMQGVENGLDVVEKLTIGFVDVEAARAESEIRRELWKPLLLLALVVLIAEWYIYNKRVYI